MKRFYGAFRVVFKGHVAQKLHHRCLVGELWWWFPFISMERAILVHFFYLPKVATSGIFFNPTKETCPSLKTFIDFKGKHFS